MEHKCAGQWQAKISIAKTYGEVKAILNEAPQEFRAQLMGHAVTIRGLREKAVLKARK